MYHVEKRSDAVSLDSVCKDEGVKILSRAKAAVHTAVDFFDAQDVYVGEMPTVAYSPHALSYAKWAVASAHSAPDTFKNLVHRFGHQFMQRTYKHLGLRVSDAAVKEALGQALRDDRKCIEIMYFAHDYRLPEDIIIYPNMRRSLASIDEIIAHEVWHVIEFRHGFLHGKDLVYEGTATFAQNFFAERFSLWDFSEPTYHLMMYDNAASLVDRLVGHKVNPLQSILDRRVRAQIVHTFNKQILPFIYDLHPNRVIEGDAHSFVRCVASEDPAYADFSRDPSSENLLRAFQNLGFRRLAKELSGHDTRLLVKLFEPGTLKQKRGRKSPSNEKL